jgi:hydrogenase expression/formation protein HypD
MKPVAMKFLDEYRDGAAVAKIAAAIARTVTRPWTIMEVCGGQTHTIVKYGIDELLPPEIELVHGPGCPVCVTSLEMIDRAHAIASRAGVIFCSFGDMLRVPGSRGDLLQLKSEGSDVRIVYSPLDAVNLAAANPDRQVVFFAIGFETTAPPNAMAVWLAHRRGLKNFSVLVSHVLVPPAMTAILQSPGNRVQGFLGPGHVCTVMGYEEYEPLAVRFDVPIVVTGFEPLDMLEGVLWTVRQLEAGRAEVENQYARAVSREGNRRSRDLIDDVFEICDRKWRGVGLIPMSGYKLRSEYALHDAERRFEVDNIDTQESTVCISGQVLRGLKKPHECPAFGKECTPQTPLGATMVSAEGACAAYYIYGRHLEGRQRRGPGGLNSGESKFGGAGEFARVREDADDLNSGEFSDSQESVPQTTKPPATAGEPS